MTIVDKLVSDELWEAVEPLLPPEPPKPKGGRPRMPPRAVFSGIVYVLKTGIPWRMLPKEFGCSGVTCWRRLRDWCIRGVREAIPDAAQFLGQGRPHRLVEGQRQFGQHTGEKGARRPDPTR